MTTYQLPPSPTVPDRRGHYVAGRVWVGSTNGRVEALKERIARALENLRPSHGVPSIPAAIAALEGP